MTDLEKELKERILAAHHDNAFANSVIGFVRHDDDKKLLIEFLKQRPNATERSILIGVVLLCKRRRSNEPRNMEEEYY